ncbi:MAG: 5-formyltetrahydrofolate cyclo-ligase [Gammaproteobacteria bacterium]
MRRAMRVRRTGLSAEEQEQAAQFLAHRLSVFFGSHPIAKIGSYLPVRNEIDPNGFRVLMGQRAPAIYLPRLAGKMLEFVLWDPLTPMGANAFGIPEPLKGPTLPAEACPCILLPLTAFDPCGRRLGSGGGFYDRTLAFRMKPMPGRFDLPLLIGVAHDCQRIDRIEPNPWDVPLDAVATDRCWYLKGETLPELTWKQLSAH